jgi:hypothetical protein
MQSRGTEGSELRMPINLALIGGIRSDWWRETLLSYLGRS